MRRLKAAERREQLIAVATKLFAKWGYNATTTAAIAEAAGVTEPILYRHFKNKQELFVAITRDVSQRTLNEWRDLIRQSDDPAEQIRLISTNFPGHLKRLADEYHVIHGALATSRDRKVTAVMREHYTQIEDFFAAIIEAGQAKKIFRSDADPRVFAWHLIKMGIGYTMITLNLPNFGKLSIEEGIEFVLRGLRP